MKARMKATDDVKIIVEADETTQEHMAVAVRFAAVCTRTGYSLAGGHEVDFAPICDTDENKRVQARWYQGIKLDSLPEDHGFIVGKSYAAEIKLG